MQRESLVAYKALDAYNDVLWARMFNPFCDIEHFPPITFVIHAVYWTKTPPQLLSPLLSGPLAV